MFSLPLAWSRGGFGPKVPGSVWNSGAGGVERLVRTTEPRYLKGNQKDKDGIVLSRIKISNLHSVPSNIMTIYDTFV
jgi:hypothetical protein